MKTPRNNQIIRSRVQRARKQSAISQHKFARLAGISQAWLSNFETGKVDLSAEKLRDVEQALLKLARVRVGQTLKALLEVVA